MSKSYFIREFAQKELFKKKTNPEDRKIQAKRDITEDLGKYKDFLRNPEYNTVQKKRIVNAIDNINANEKLEQQLDSTLKASDDLRNKFNDIQKDEQSLIEELNTKYGDGTLDLDSGTFTPNKSE